MQSKLDVTHNTIVAFSVLHMEIPLLYIVYVHLHVKQKIYLSNSHV